MYISRRNMLRVLAAASASAALTGCGAASAQIDTGAFTSWIQGMLGYFGAGGVGGAAASGEAGSGAAGGFAAELGQYDPDPLTGEARREGGRLVAVMVNNISASKRQNARPQRGLSSADIIIESRVEGGISRLCAVYRDASYAPEVGPIRSGRDQFLQLIMPWQALYYHDGESIFCTQFVHEYGYSGLNIGGKSYFNTPTHLQVSHRDSRGRDVAYEHTEFTSGDEIKKAAAEAGIDLSAQYEGTAFSFADYRTGEVNAMQGQRAASNISIAHSDSYKTSFNYSVFSQTYKTQMYNPADGKFEDAVDELTGKALEFANVVVCFADIAAYAGDSHDVQQVNFAAGGEVYLFTRGAVAKGRWEKPHPTAPLALYDENGAELKLNRGKTYLALVDVDEAAKFSY